MNNKSYNFSALNSIKVFCLVFALFLSTEIVVAQNQLTTAQDLYDAGQYESARNLLEPLSRQKENDTAVQSLLGSVYAKLALWEKAADQVEGLVEKYPDNAEYHFRYGGALGMVAKNANKFTALTMLDDVKYHLKKATELDPNHINSRWALVQLYVELPSIIGGTKAIAMKYAKQLENISPVDAALAKGFVEKSTENYADAEKHLKKAVEIGQSETTYTKLAELYQVRNQKQKVFDTLKKGIAQTNAVSLKIKFAQLAQNYNQEQQNAFNYLKDLHQSELSSSQKKKVSSLMNELQ